MFGSYFTTPNGVINQAAAGIGALPPQAAAGFGRLPPQAAAGFGNDAPLPPITAYRDGVLGNRYFQGGDPNRLQSWKDGIFGPPLGADATGAPTYDMSDAEALKQFKLVLNYVMSSPEGAAISPAAIDTAAYGQETEDAFKAWAAKQPDAASMAQTVSGHVIPTTSGLYFLFSQGIQMSSSAGGNYAGTYWPMPTAYKQAIDSYGPGASMIAPKFDGTGREGSLKASTLMLGAGAAVLFGGAFLLLRKKRR